MGNSHKRPFKNELAEYRQPSELCVRDRVHKPYKILLLGAGEVGKSTLFSQTKIIHKGGFSDEEKLSMKRVVMDNVLQSMVQLVIGARKLKIELEDSNYQDMAENVLKADVSLEESSNIEEILPRVLNDIELLWKLPSIHRAYDQRHLFFAYEEQKYFLDDAKRISAPDFIPTAQDILTCYGKTLGVVEMQFPVNSYQFIITDTGGQRNERKKWAHTFDGTDIIIFMCALNEYSKTLFEDGATNRMTDSIKLFDEVCNFKDFQDKQLVLLFNKIDIFKETIKKHDPKDFCFPEYTHGRNYEKAKNYIKNQFLLQNKVQRKMLVYEGSILDENFTTHLLDEITEKCIYSTEYD